MHVLIEPVIEHAPAIERLCEQIRNSEMIWAAASNRPGRAQLSVAKALETATLGEQSGSRWSDELSREVRWSSTVRGACGMRTRKLSYRGFQSVLRRHWSAAR